MKKNESNLPLSVVDSVRAGAHTDIAQYGNPLALLGDVSRAALCASEGMELKSGDLQGAANSAPEARGLAVTGCDQLTCS